LRHRWGALLRLTGVASAIVILFQVVTPDSPTQEIVAKVVTLSAFVALSVPLVAGRARFQSLGSMVRGAE
jgi:hypothetical protein